MIDAATLTYVVNDAGDDASVNEVAIAWDELVTYNTFGTTAGVQATDYGTLVGTAEGGTAAAQTLDVRASLQRWSNGTPNHGWIFQPTGPGGVEFRSSEYTTTSQRPKLTVTYCDPATYDIGNQVWLDDNDLNGLQDALGSAEWPGGGVTVRLWNTTGVVQTTVSTRGMSYGFSGIPNADDYQIEFVLPAGYAFTERYDGNDVDTRTPTTSDTDSDADTTTGFTEVFSFNETRISSIDAGLTGGHKCYAVADGYGYDNDGDDTVVLLDLLTGKGTYISQDTETGGVEAAVYDPDTARLYAYNTSTWGYWDSVGEWTNAGTTQSGVSCVDQGGTTRTVGGDGFDAIAYNPVDDTWWAAMRLTGGTLDVVVKINGETGAIINDSTAYPYFGGVENATCASMAAPAGATNLTDIDDMAFSSDGTLYLLANNGELEGRVTVPYKNAGGEYTGEVLDLGGIYRVDTGELVNDIEGFSIDENGRVFITTGGWNIEDNVDHDTVFEIANLTGGEVLMAVPITQLSGSYALINAPDGANYSDYEAISCYGASGGGVPNPRSSLGNYIWFDTDGDGVQEVDEYGINEVKMELWGRGPDGLFGTGDDVLLATQTTVHNDTTNTDGYYMFANLPAGQYQVRLAQSNFESGGALAGLIQTTNPVITDAENANRSQTYVYGLAWNNHIRNADFGFARADLGDHLDVNFKTLLASNGPRHIVFPDPGNDGTPAAWGGVEAVWLGATVDTEGNGQPTTGATGDDANPSAIDDEDGADIDGMTWSGLNLQLPVTVSSSGAPTGQLYVAAWIDWNANGIFDATEMYKVPVSLGSNTLSLAAPSTFQDYDPSLEIRLRLYAGDPGTPSPVGLVVNGEVEDYVRGVNPTGITLAAITASVQGDAIEVTWDTASEIDNLGFNLYRRLSPDGPEIRLNADLIPSQGSGSPMGFHYTFLDDAGLVPGATYLYTLEDINTAGVATRHEPVSIVYSGGPTAVSLSAFAASSGFAPATRGATPASLPALAVLCGLVLAAAALRPRPR